MALICDLVERDDSEVGYSNLSCEIDLSPKHGYPIISENSVSSVSASDSNKIPSEFSEDL